MAWTSSPYNTTKLFKHAPCRTVTASGHQWGHAMGVAQMLLSAWDVRPFFPDLDLHLGLDLDLDFHFDEGAPSPGGMPLCSKQDQNRNNLLLQATTCNGQQMVDHGSCVNDEVLSDDGLVRGGPVVTRADVQKDPLAVKHGPGRYDHKVGASDIPRGSHTEQAIDAEFNKGPALLNAAWKHSDESTHEAETAIQKAERLGILPGLPMSRTSPRNIQAPTCRLFTAALENSMAAKNLCATEDRPSPTGAHCQGLSFPCVSNTARQTQVHESEDAVHRLMPPNRIICFNVNRDSFRRGSVPDEVTDLIVSAAKEIASVIEEQNLGISFAYSPNSASNVFAIRYDPSLGRRTLAQSFFPSDSRTYWEMGISHRLVSSKSELVYLTNIFAHEFAHILGLRHWNAGTHEAERSFQWPNTKGGSKDSVMITGVHPSEIRFSTEDFRVIREIYSLVNGDMFAGREIIDVYP